MDYSEMKSSPDLQLSSGFRSRPKRKQICYEINCSEFKKRSHPGSSKLRNTEEANKKRLAQGMSLSNGHHDCISTVTLLLRCNADINATDNAGRTPLSYAAESGNFELVEELVSHGANVNLDNGFEFNSPLALAFEKQYEDIVDYLVDHGSWITLNNLNRFLCTGNTQAIKLLQSFSTENMVIEGRMGNSVLHWAAMENNLQAMKAILDCKISDINAPNDNGETPLHSAAQCGKLEAVKYLIKRGAHLQAVDIHNRKPFSLALISRHIEVAKFLDRYEKFVICSPGNKIPKKLLPLML